MITKDKKKKKKKRRIVTMFREQVGTVSTWFDRWTPCEQTVAMVALLRRLQPTQARFLTAVLHRQLNDCGDVRRAEILANDPSKSCHCKRVS